MMFLAKLFVIVPLVLAFFSFSMELKKVDKNLYMVRGDDGLPSPQNKGFISNAFGVLTDKGWIVIDTLTTPELSKKFLTELKKIADKPILYAIITHYHLDHWYGAKTFKDIKAKIIGHENLKKVYDSGEAQGVLNSQKKIFKGILDSVILVEPDITVKVNSKKTLKVGEDVFEIYAMPPAHTNTDLVVYWKNRKVLFVGDLVYKERIPFMGDRNSSSKGWLKVLERLKSFDALTILGGHNYPMDKSAIDWTYSYIKFVRETVKRLKDEGYFIDEIKDFFKGNPYEKVKMYKVFHNRNVWKVYNDLDLELE